MRAFFDAAAREQASATVKQIEAQSSAEIVICVRRASGHYRHVDYAAGALLSLVALAVLMFSDDDFGEWVVLALCAAAFAIGVLVVHYVRPLRRLLVSKKLIDEYVGKSARAAFVELGVSRTRGRTGVLVFVSLFERRAVLVPDIGVDASAIAAWSSIEAALAAAMRPPRPQALFEALKRLGPALAPALPHAADDINELPDEPQVSA